MPAPRASRRIILAGICRSRASRAEFGGELLQGRDPVEGWLANRLSTPWPDSGLMMNMCAVAGLRSAPQFVT